MFIMIRSNKIFCLVGLLLIATSWLVVGGIATAADIEIVDLVPQKIYSDEASIVSPLGLHRSLQLLQPFTCSNYEFTVQIRIDLRMSYVVTNDRIKVELEYDGEGWIALGTNPDREGKMVGGEAWVALPAASDQPSIYNMNGIVTANVVEGDTQTLENGFVSQSDGVTLLQFDKLLSDGDNVSINGNANVVFLWAIGRTNTFGQHIRRGAFRLALEPCTAPVFDTEEVELDVVCGFFGLNVFCPLSQCGFFGRLIGLC